MSDDKLKLGVMVHLRDDPEGAIKKVADLGVPTCQLGWPPGGTLETGKLVRKLADDHGVTITTLWAALPGLAVCPGPRQCARTGKPWFLEPLAFASEDAHSPPEVVLPAASPCGVVRCV